MTAGSSFINYVNLAAGIYWPIFIILAHRSGEISFGTIVPKATRADHPEAFWSIMAFLTAMTLVLWFLVARWVLGALQG